MKIGAERRSDDSLDYVRWKYPGKALMHVHGRTNVRNPYMRVRYALRIHLFLENKSRCIRYGVRI